MKYLKSPKTPGKLNVRITIKDHDGVTTNIVMEECDEDKVTSMLGFDATYSNSNFNNSRTQDDENEWTGPIT